MIKNKISRLLFIIDVFIIYCFFFLVFFYYNGETMIPLKGNILMGLIVIFWFLISVNSNILKINRLSNTIKVLKDILIAYSVLSTVTIATVAIFGEFKPNDKLILYPLLFGVISSTVLRFLYLFIINQFLKYGYQQKSVLLIGSGHSAKQVIAKILSTPELGLRIKVYCLTVVWILPLKGTASG